MQIHIIAFSGSSRRESLNQKLLDTAAAGARDAGGQVSNARLSDFQLPIYDGDWEAGHGLPDGALALKKLLADHHAFLIASPEHNGGYTAMLKNTLDWASRPCKDDSTGVASFTGKVAALVSASPGPLGAIRAQLGLQTSLNKLGVHVIPNGFAMGAAHQAFDEQRHLKDAAVEKLVRGVGAALVKTSTAIVNGGK